MLKQTMTEFLRGEVLENALDFADFLDVNEMTHDGAEVSDEDDVICYMYLDDGDEYPSPWTIWTDGDYSWPLHLLNRSQGSFK